MNLMVMKFEGDKPQLGNYVELADTDNTVRKVTGENCTNIIGYRAPAFNRVCLSDNEILIKLINVIDNMDVNKTIYVSGLVLGRRFRIVITNPQPSDKVYAQVILKNWNKEIAFILKDNMDIELVGTDWMKRFNDAYPIW